MWRWLAALLLTLLLLLAGALAWLAATERGAAWLAGEAQRLSGDTVVIRGLRGTVAGGLQADELRVLAGATEIVARDVRFALRPAAFLGGRLAIVALSAAEVVVTLSGEEPDEEPFVMPTLRAPLPVELADAAIGTLVLRDARTGEARTATGIRIAGTLEGTRLEVLAARAIVEGLDLQVAGTAELTGELPLDARIEWRLAGPALSGAGTVKGRLDALAIEQLVRVPEPVTVTATLEDLLGDARLAATMRWEAIRRELPGVGTVRAVGGQASLAGWLDDWQGEMATALESDRWPVMQASAGAHGDMRHVVLDAFTLTGEAGTLAARGDVELDGAPRLRLDVSARDIATAVLRPGLEGRLSAEAAVSARLPGEFDVRLADLRGRLMGRPLAGSGELGWREGTLTFRRVELRAGANRLSANGSVGARLAGRFSLHAPELDVLWPGLAGRVTADARVAGSRQRPEIALTADVEKLRLDGNSVGDLALRLKTDRRARIEASLRAHGVQAGETALGDLAADASGTLGAHRLHVQLSGGVAALDLASEGSWDGTTLRHRLGAVLVEDPRLGAWRLAGEPEVALRAGSFAIGPHCWEQAPAALCIGTLRWSPARTEVAAELRDFALSRLSDLLARPDFALSGSLYATVTAELAGGTLVGSASAHARDATVRYTGGDEPLVTPLDVARLDANFTRDGGSAVAELASTASGLALTVRASAAGALGPDAPLDVEVVGRLPDVSPLVPVFAGDFDIAEVAGEVAVDASIGGTYRAPQFTGVARLSKGAVAFTDLGVKLEAIDVALLGDGSDRLRLRGSARAGGPVTLGGEALPFAAGGPSGWIRVHGNRIDAVRLPDRYVQVSPDITLRYAGGELVASGSVTIPKADVRLRELPATAVSPSPDAIVVDRAAQDEEEGAPAIRGEIALVFGRDVRLRAFGLDTKLEGTLSLVQGGDREAKVFGVVRLREGKFGAYGKELQIERGTLGFSGPPDDPAVDLRASRRVEWEGRTVTAGILVSGTASRPESRVFSEPAMSQADALSYLVSGRPMQSTSPGERSSIAGAALALGVGGASPITERLGEAITLDELGMQGGIGETEVVAGKQFGSDLYVRFAYGLFSRVGTVLARYRIGRNLSLEAASGEDESLDLIWSIEKD